MRLGKSSNYERYAIGDVDLHCGDCFEVQLKNKKWLSVRIEYGEDWYLIDENENRYEMPYYSVPARFQNSERKYDRWR